MALAMTTLCANAQQLKQFSLEDLNFGGTNYKNMVPKRLNLWWDGNTLVDAEKQPDKKRARQYPLVYSKDHNIFVKTSEDAEAVQVTKKGTRQIPYGEAVHRNEFGIDGGIFLSPDKKQYAFYRMDQSMVTDYPQVNTFTRSAELDPDAYPMAGMTSHKVTIGILGIDETNEDKAVYLKVGDPTDRYFTNIAWSPDSKLIYLMELNRDQNDMILDVYDAATGDKLRTIYREQDEKYVEPMHPVTFLPWDSSKFIMWSQKDGYNHLYLMDVNGKMIKQITKGNWVVQELLGFCPKTKSIIIASNELNPLQTNLFSVKLTTGKRTLLDNGIGVHSGVLSEDGTKLIDSYSAPDVPRAYVITNVAKPTQEKEYFRAPDPWEGYEVPTYLSGSIKAADGKTDLYYRMVLPAGLNPDDYTLSPDGERAGERGRYPTVIYVYGGPHAHNVGASWHWMSRPWETYMAQKGYVLFILDNRGSENRGKEFEQATFRQLGQVEMQDQMQGVEYLKTLPYVDMNRLGVHGWSFGGFMTTSLMTTYPDVFKVGVAGGPVIDWKWYEVMYGERYMDTPQTNPEGYEKASLINKAKNLKGKLQIIIGMNDPTVVPQHALQFLDACVKAGTQPDFFVYPGEGHNMRGHASVHLHERITQYFEDYLK